MLYTFRAKVAGDVLMLDRHARPLLEAAGKTADVARQNRGVFTPEQLAAAIAGLESYIARLTPDEKAQAELEEKARQQHDDSDPQKSERVFTSQRAYPLLDLLRKAEAAGVNVMWETSGA